jgi:hypothetical protein
MLSRAEGPKNLKHSFNRDSNELQPGYRSPRLTFAKISLGRLPVAPSLRLLACQPHDDGTLFPFV